MKCLVICEGASSAMLYVEEARRRGLFPIVVYPPRDGRIEDDNCVAEFLKKIGGGIEVIYVEDGGYGKLLKRLRGYSVAAVVAGSEYGVRYSDMLARDLSLNGNDPDTTYLRCTKKGMAEALGKSGMRYIATSIVSCEDDIDIFWDENDIEAAFMKPNEGASSNNSRICHTRREAKDFFRKAADAQNCFGNRTELLIQEYIGGDEYIVNTVSCRGKHVVTDVWKYEKCENDDSNPIYKSARVVNADSPEIKALTEYALKTVEATGFEYGPCHGEYKIDRKGPVLIETNARPMGFNMNSSFLKRCFGHCIADYSLDSYMNPNGFLAEPPDDYIRPKEYGVMLMPYSVADADVDLEKYYGGLRRLKTVEMIVPELASGTVHVKKTTDLDTVLMEIRLCGERNDVENDVSEIDGMNAAFLASLSGNQSL